MTALFPSESELDEILVEPQSVSWRITSDARLYFAMLYPLLLQVAHPTVSAGVCDYSDFERRPWDRLLGTLEYVSLLVYGGAEAVPAGRRLRALHQGFHGIREDGTSYSALDPEAYAWVHATLLQTYVAAHARFGTPLRTDEIERFYREYRGLGRVIGVRERDLPPDWPGFCAYFERMIEAKLTRTDSVESVLRTVRQAPAPPIAFPDALWRTVRVPARRALYLGSVGLLTTTLRQRLGAPWSRFDEAQFRALGRASRSLTPVMPQSLKVMGPALLRWRRAAIARGPLGAAPGGRDRRPGASPARPPPRDP